MCYYGNTVEEQILKSESAHKVDPREENSPTTPAGIQTHDLSIMGLSDMEVRGSFDKAA